ncbi:hypothetical protein M422DRAFT_50393 [Sphaerobolus stellatus SS14]|uniref:Uncharacterized protein n=1 Tax=Sphaerobolus stellatus (strain SS14) TaxID=990650 RepID=A0A0C9VJ29_SPHS4|nr:hypothetical protein M422DRAFT_50393 [Sphaerobolus stellatus SS14]
MPSPLSRSSSALMSLLTPAYFVTPAWLDAITSIDLFNKFKLPSEQSYLPPVDDPSLSSLEPNVWAPSQKRKGLFDGLRFTFAVIGSGIGTDTKAIADAVQLGGTQIQFIDVEAEAGDESKSGWDTALRKRRRKDYQTDKIPSGCGLILVADAESMHARGVSKEIQSAWDGMVNRASEVDMRIISPSFIVDAILKCDISILDCKQQKAAVTQSDEPFQIPESESVAQPEPEPEPETAPRRPRLTRRATSQTPVQPPPEIPSTPDTVVEIVEPPSTAPEPPASTRKPLKRRANATGLLNTILGIDEDTSMVIEPSPKPASEPVAQTPTRPSRLKRRVNTAASSSQLQSLMEEEDDAAKRPLKKFRALFEGTMESADMAEDIDKVVKTGPNEQSQGLSIVQEEEEEEESATVRTQEETQGRKRRLQDVAEEEDESQSQATTQARKKRAVEGSNAVERRSRDLIPALQSQADPRAGPSLDSQTQAQPKTQARKASKSGSGVAPDMDQNFMLAVTSRSKSKRTEDAFDREFNNLRISKPDPNNLANTTNNPNWEALDEFACDMNIRGNFMQIVEMKVKEKNKEGLQRRGGDRLDWEGREDFKKFKKKSRVSDRELVQVTLNAVENDGESQPPQIEFNYAGVKQKQVKARQKKVITEDENENDYQSDSPMPTAGPSAPKQTQAASRQGGTRRRPAPVMEEDDDDDDDDEIPTQLPVRKAPTQTKARAASKPPLKAKAKSPTPFTLPSTVTTRKKAFQPLFDPASDDEDFSLPPTQARSPEPMQSQASETPDLDLTYRSTSTRAGVVRSQATRNATQGPRGTKRKPVLEDSDSNGDGVVAKRGKRRK